MTHQDLTTLVQAQLTTQDLGDWVAASLTADISTALAELPRGERVLCLVRLSQHLAHLTALGPDRCADPDRVAQLLGITRR